MAWVEPKKLVARRTPEACIKYFSRIRRDVPVRLIRLVRAWGEEDGLEYGMIFFIGAIAIDRYEVRFRNGTYTIFDTY